MTRETAATAFLARLDTCRSLLQALSAHVDDHLGASPDEVHWGHVGSAAKIEAELKEMAQFLGLAGQE